jgi:hypothetical protein
LWGKKKKRKKRGGGGGGDINLRVKFKKEEKKSKMGTKKPSNSLSL